MGRKDLHIVFGVQAKYVIEHSEMYDADATEFVCFQDTLSIGPIAGLNTRKCKEDRIKWLTEVYAEFPADELANIVYSDGKLIHSIKEHIDQYSSIYLWTGSDVNEILGASRLLYSLKEVLSVPIFTIDFSNISLIGYWGNLVFPRSLNETEISQVGKLQQHFQLILQPDSQKMQLQWETLSRGNSNLRIPIGSSQITEADIDFYDSIILEQCKHLYQQAVVVIGNTLGYMNNQNIREGIGDSFLNWRLKKLIEQNNLKYRGDMSSMRTYEVKLA